MLNQLANLVMSHLKTLSTYGSGSILDMSAIQNIPDKLEMASRN